MKVNLVHELLHVKDAATTWSQQVFRISRVRELLRSKTLALIFNTNRKGIILDREIDPNLQLRVLLVAMSNGIGQSLPHSGDQPVLVVAATLCLSYQIDQCPLCDLDILETAGKDQVRLHAVDLSYRRHVVTTHSSLDAICCQLVGIDEILIFLTLLDLNHAMDPLMKHRLRLLYRECQNFRQLIGVQRLDCRRYLLEEP